MGARAARQRMLEGDLAYPSAADRHAVPRRAGDLDGGHQPSRSTGHGFVEETHFTVAYSPVAGRHRPRGIGGVLATVHEITEKVIGERRR